MRKKLLHRLTAGALSLVMAISLACVGALPASAAGTTYTFAPSDVNLGAEATTDKAIIPEGTTFAGGYIRVIGKVTQRYQDTKGGVYCVEVDKDQKGALEFTTRATADVTVSAASTGGSNSSTVGLINMADGSVVANKEGVGVVTGTAAATLTYSGLAAGTYQVVSTITDDESMNRGVRIHGVTITEAGDGAAAGGESVTVNYNFGPGDVNLGAEATTDKAIIPEGTTYADGFMKIIGKVTQRYQDTKGGVYCVEVDKDQKGAIEFTVTGTADVTVTAASTGGSNSSAVGLVNTGTGAVVPNKEGVSIVTGTATTNLTYSGLTAGSYQVVSTITEDDNLNRGVRIHAVSVAHTTTGARADRTAWADVAAPVITGAAVNEGAINVTFDAKLGYDGADKVTVSMVDSTGAVVASSPAAQGNSVTIMPEKSDTFTFQIVASRSGEADKAGTPSAPVAFVLPLAKPSISSATSAGGGKVSVVWAAVPEATGYTVFVGGNAAATAAATECEVSGLAVGSDAVITVAAVRGEEVGPQCDAVTVKVTQDAKQVWNFARFGPSTNEDNNGFTGDLNNGKVTIYSEGGKGKIQPGADDGIAYYYTAVPENKNFTLRANVHVDKWTYSNGQEGFGMLVRDSVPETGETGSHWSNQYMVMASKVEYKYDTGKILPATAADGTKYSMRLGIGTLAKLGLTPSNYKDVEKFVKEYAPGITYPLDLTGPNDEESAGGGTYNIVGNYTNKPDGTIADITDFVMEIQRNNTGYFLTYYDKSGNIIGQQKNYEPKAQSHLDTDNVYVGFFAARNARITVSNAKFSTISPANDKPAEERPVEEITPELTIPSNSLTSGSASTTPEYTLMVKSNVKGTAEVSLNGESIGKFPVDGINRTNVPVTLHPDRNYADVTFTPSKDQGYDEYTRLASTEPMKTRVFIYYDTKFIDAEELYVAPLPVGKYNNTGSKDSPLDIYTAVKSVHPGQTIYLTEGVYYLSDRLEILRGMNGTEEKPIRMLIDPEAKARPVLDLRGGSTFTHGGDWWYFGGFDVTNSGDGNPGFAISGNHNVLDQVNAYHNGNTGIQIRRLGNADTVIAEWPSYNLILNCTSYGNADDGYEDADGFACKQTAGEGNVFDGCVAYNNADDGFDLYANAGRPIGAVVIKNSIAYSNGYLEDGTNAGNGNGFKMGGSSVAVDHKLINSFVFFNKAKGIDCNSCPNLKVENVTTYNNENYNVALYTNNANDTAFEATGILSFKDKTIKDGFGVEENFKPKGSQDTRKYTGSSNYYWDGAASQNSSGKKIGADAFVSLEFKGVTRNEDGTPNLGDFLKKSDKAPEKSGADGTGTASAFTAPQEVAVAAMAVPETTPAPTAEPTPEPAAAPEAENSGNGGVIGIVIAIIVVVAAVAGGAYYYMTQKKKKDGAETKK